MSPVADFYAGQERARSLAIGVIVAGAPLTLIPDPSRAETTHRDGPTPTGWGEFAFVVTFGAVLILSVCAIYLSGGNSR